MLETPITWIMCLIYITVTVVAGCPLVTGIATSAGLDKDSRAVYGTLCELGRWR